MLQLRYSATPLIEQLTIDQEEITMFDLRVVAGKPEHVARAMMDGKPVSEELVALYSRVLQEHVAELAEQHGVEPEPEPNNVVPFPSR